MKLELLPWPIMLFMFMRPPKNGEFCLDEAILFLGFVSCTMLSLRSTDFTSEPELGSFRSTPVVFFLLCLTLPVLKTFPVIENLCPILLLEDFSPVARKLLFELP